MTISEYRAMNPVGGSGAGTGSAEQLKRTEQSFGDSLTQALKDVNDLQSQAGQAIESMVAGEEVDLHDVMIAVEKAKTSFDLLLEVRNKTLDMFREMMRMQV